MPFRWGKKERTREPDRENPIRVLRAAEELEAALRADLAVLYKHSDRCGICFRSLREVQKFAEAHPDVPVFMIDVVADRELSSLAAERLGVVHQSPQAIVVRAGEALWDGSHVGVTAGKLEGFVSTVH